MIDLSANQLQQMSERLLALPILLRAYHVRLFETDYRSYQRGSARPTQVDNATRAVRNESRRRYNHVRQRAGLPVISNWAKDPNDHT